MQCKPRALKARFKYRVGRLCPDESRFQRQAMGGWTSTWALPQAALDSAPLPLNIAQAEFGNEDRAEHSRGSRRQTGRTRRYVRVIPRRADAEGPPTCKLSHAVQKTRPFRPDS